MARVRPRGSGEGVEVSKKRRRNGRAVLLLVEVDMSRGLFLEVVRVEDCGCGIFGVDGVWNVRLEDGVGCCLVLSRRVRAREKRSCDCLECMEILSCLTCRDCSFSRSLCNASNVSAVGVKI